MAQAGVVDSDSLFEQMSEKTNIAWTDSTINFWSGCTMVPAANGLKDSGCLHCYAKDRDDRQLQETVSHWGKGAKRLKHVGAVKSALVFNRKPWICECGAVRAWKEVSWNVDGTAYCNSCHQQGAKYHRRRIFSLSLGDWLDDEVPIEWLAEMLDTIRRCDQVTWILCTKRLENFFSRLRAVQKIGGNPKLFGWIDEWLGGPALKNNWAKGKPPSNIILLTSVENQAMADKRIPELLKIPAACHGLSLEPLLCPVVLPMLQNIPVTPPWIGNESWKIDWIIIGCESGSKRRDCDGNWIRSLVEQGKSAGVAAFVKQILVNGKVSHDPKEWPTWAQIQEWPKGF